MKRHIKTHDADVREKRKRVPYECDSCSNHFQFRPQLFSHYQKCHGITLNKYIEFNNELDFNEWKDKLEIESSTFFVRQRNRIDVDAITTYFGCHRSGTNPVEMLSNSARLCKSQGSEKIGKKCTAYMISKQDINSKKVLVDYCLEHKQHTIDLAHLPVSKKSKTEITEKLHQGVEPNKILDSIRNNACQKNKF